MRKIWSRKDKDKEKRKSFTGPSLYHTTSNQTHRDSAEIDQNYWESQQQVGSNASTYSNTTATLGTLGTSGTSGTVTTANTTIGSIGTTGTSTTVHGDSDEVTDKDQRKSGPKTVTSLIKYDYDAKLIKNSWLNVIINTNSVNEISEHSLKVFRAELKGSHLYLFKSNLNYKNFRVSKDQSKDDVSSLFGGASVKNLDMDQVSISGPINVSNPLNSTIGTISGPMNVTHPTKLSNSNSNSNSNLNANSNANFPNEDGNLVEQKVLQPPEIFKNLNNSNNSIHSPTLSHQSLSTPLNTITNNGNSSNGNNNPINSSGDNNNNNNNNSSNEDFRITYFKTVTPHPELKFDYDKSTFISGSSIESLIHFLFFQYDAKFSTNIDQLISMIPILPNLGKNLRLLNSFLISIFSHSFEGEYNLEIIVERILLILNNIHDNFKGFLLKSDIAPYILKLLESLNDNLKFDEENHDNENNSVKFNETLIGLKTFKSKMLSSQQSLINLISYNDKLIDLNPLHDLSASYFLNHVNIIEFASSISSIDLKFLHQWNSSIDKSLLLYSSINKSLNSDFFYNKNPLFFNNEYHIHYLSRLLINQLFCETNITSLNCTSSLLEFKARLLEKWIDLGCLLDKSGNMSSWLGIASIILSQPILRLSKIWTFVSIDYIKLLKNDWSPVLFELDRRFLVNGFNASNPNSPNQQSINQNTQNNNPDLDQRETSYHIMVPRGLGKIYPKERVVPYFGDLIINNVLNPNHPNYANNANNVNDLEMIYKKINISFKRWNEYLDNLTNYNEIIKYNDDVLKRYDSMGFIFSNESLNQVLYLGANNDEAKPLPQSFELNNDNLFTKNVNSNLSNQLLKLIEINVDSVNLDKLMDYSLVFQPELPENYLKPLINPIFDNKHASKSNISLNSTDSLNSGQNSSSTLSNVNNIGSNTDLNNINESNPASRIPLFNNNHFKINLLKYDELAITSNNGQLISSNHNTVNHTSVNDNKNSSSSADNENDQITPLASTINNGHHNNSNTQINIDTDKHNIPIDDELVFRIDDFVNEIDNNLTTSGLNALDEDDHDEDDEYVPGLGIDVDDILNSDKFSNFQMNSTETDPSEKQSQSHGHNSLGQSHSQSQTPSQPSSLPQFVKKSGNVLSNQSFSVISSDSSQLQIYKYIPKYANIDKLVDLLLIDSKYLDESINIDLTEYRFVFLLNYNSFITTRQLLEILAHRFINSGNAVISIMKKMYLIKTNQLNEMQSEFEFPNWNLDSTVALNDLGEVDYSLLLKIQINILKVLVVLINNFYTNFSLDLINKKILIKLLKLFSNEILQWYNSNKIDVHLEKSFESLVNYYKKLKKLFVRKTYRPLEISKFDEFLINEFKFNNSLHEVPINRNLPGHKNVNKIEKFLHKFNKLLTVFYKGIRAEDWFKIFKILEVEFEKNALLEFDLQKNAINDENLIISNIFNYFETLTDSEEKVLILKKFPLVFRKLFKLYSKFKTYISVQLTDLNITVDERLDRMKTLLYMVKICQLKMSDNQFVFEGINGTNDRDTIIPSCIESAITNVIYTSESRLFSNLWVKASNSLNNEDASNIHFDDLNSLLPKHLKTTDLILNHEPLLPCFGWIIENLIEINKCPNFTNTHLINFNKRYLIYKLIKELTVEDLDANEEFTHNDTREFEFLLKLDENLINNQNLKEFTFLEKDKIKLFKNVLKDQHRILIIDNRKKQLKEGNKNESEHHVNNSNLNLSNLHQNNNSNSSINSQSINKKSSNPSLRRQSLSYKTNSTSRFKISGFFNKSRPFSLGGNNNNHQNYQEKSINVKDLPNPSGLVDNKQKPFVVIPLKNKKIFPVYLLPLSFKIDNDQGGEDYFFQCLDENDLNDWLMKLSYANKHWFFSRTLNIRNPSNFTTFGIPINVICNRQSSLVPKFLIDMFDEIEADGIKSIGIYRISTSISELNNLKSMIDKTGYIDFEERSYDVHALTSCIKSFFREFPDALLTDKVIEKLFKLRQTIQSEDRSSTNINVPIIIKFKEILKSLPTVNYETFKALSKHLNKVVQFSDENKMTPANIATVIGPALTEASSLELLVNNFGFMNFILEKIVVNYEAIFEKSISELREEGDEDVEADEEAEAEIEESEKEEEEDQVANDDEQENQLIKKVDELQITEENGNDKSNYIES